MSQRRTADPRPPGHATVRGTLGPVVWAVVAIVVTLLMPLLWHVLTPAPETREPLVRYIVQNRSEQWLTRVALTAAGGAAGTPATVLQSGPELAPGGRWVVDLGLDEPRAWGVEVDEGGRRHEFRAVRFTPHGELRIVTIQPGPCIRGERADVTTRR